MRPEIANPPSIKLTTLLKWRRRRLKLSIEEMAENVGISAKDLLLIEEGIVDPDLDIQVDIEREYKLEGVLFKDGQVLWSEE